MKRHGPWRTLGLDPTEDRSAIRRAYADKLRALDVDKDIEGYTRLRQARDHALVLAKGLAQAEADAPAADGHGEPRSPIADLAEPETDGELLERADAADRPVPSEETGQPDEPTEPPPPQILLSILFPDGQQSDQPLSSEEWDLAQAALAAILREAEASSVDAHSAIDGWLAHYLASAWPRSAWLVEPAAEAFGWMEESGQLVERPAVQFLNLRLRGLRFVAKVEQPGHPLHHAWTELSKPGPKGTFAFMRVGKDDVAQLLSGIRERYPEVESYLDPQRVASWEGSMGVTPASAWLGSFPIFAVVALLALVRLCSTAAGDHQPAVPPPPIAVGVAWSAEQVDDLVVELFGTRVDNDRLRNEAPELWNALDRASGFGGDTPIVVDDTRRALVRQLRAQTQLAARDAAFDELVAIKQMKLGLLRIVREQGGADDCLDFETQLAFPTFVDVPEAVRAEERALAARLAGSNLLRPSDTRFPQSATIPGPVIEQIMKATSMPEDVVRQAIGGVGSDRVLCDYRIALLEAVLKRPADATADLLRII